jgi:hypothetical protein
LRTCFQVLRCEGASGMRVSSLVWDRRRRYLGEQHHFLCQYPEKTIPLSIESALQAKPLPIYGDGSAQGLRRSGTIYNGFSLWYRYVT